MADEGGVDGVEGYEDSGGGGEEGGVTWVISLSVLKLFRPEVLQVGHSSWVVGWIHASAHAKGALAAS